MSDEPRILHKLNTPDGIFHGWAIMCPGCGFAHVFDQRWTFDGNMEAPTFDSSMLVHRSRNWPAEFAHGRCHSFVRQGRIEFLKDCDHDLAGQTVKLEPW